MSSVLFSMNRDNDKMLTWGSSLQHNCFFFIFSEGRMMNLYGLMVSNFSKVKGANCQIKSSEIAWHQRAWRRGDFSGKRYLQKWLTEVGKANFLGLTMTLVRKRHIWGKVITINLRIHGFARHEEEWILINFHNFGLKLKRGGYVILDEFVRENSVTSV